MAKLFRREFLFTTAAAALPAANAKPNIVFVLMDDMGYPALSGQGNRFVATPNLDRLASEGMRFTDAYVTPQCTPTRSTLLTGQYTAGRSDSTLSRRTSIPTPGCVRCRIWLTSPARPSCLPRA